MAKKAKTPVEEGADPEVIEAMRAAGELPPEEGAEGGAEEGAGEGGGEGEPKPKPTPGEGEDDDGLGIDPDDETIDGKKPAEREVHIPMWKVKEREKAAAEKAREESRLEFEQKLKDAADKPADERAPDSEIAQSLADELGITPERAAKVISDIAKQVGSTITLPKDVLDRLGKLEEAGSARAETDRQQRESQGFEQEFASKSVQDALTAASGGREITAETKDRVRKLAYSETYHTYRIEDIVRLAGDKIFTHGKKGAERGKGGSGSPAVNVKFEELSPEDINNMSDEDFDRYSKALEKKSVSKITGTGR